LASSLARFPFRIIVTALDRHWDRAAAMPRIAGRLWGLTIGHQRSKADTFSGLPIEQTLT
jgi:hypothetical protein